MTFHSRRKLSHSLAILFTVIISLLVSCRHNNLEPDIKSANAALKIQADEWDQAIIRKDLTAIAGNMSADFRHISKTGEITDRSNFLKEIVSLDLVINPYSVEDFDIRIYGNCALLCDGNCALLCGRTRMTGTYQGKPFKSHYRYVDTYIYNNGKWMVCNVQITAILE